MGVKILKIPKKIKNSSGFFHTNALECYFREAKNRIKRRISWWKQC
jgi:hypothetical protein